MLLKKSFGIVLLLFSTIILYACGGSGGSSDGAGAGGGGGTGTVSLGLIDNATDKYQAVYVTIKEVHFNKHDISSDVNDRNWEVFSTPNKTYNLLSLVNGVSEVLGEYEFDAAIYKQIRLIIGETPESENNIFREPHPYANYLILKDDSYVPLKIPSGLQTGIKLVHHFEVLENEIIELLLDFDACRSVVQAGKSGKYLLKPTIKVIETDGKVDVYGEVTDDSTNQVPIVGANVSAQISDQLSATVVRSTLTDDSGEYLLLLSPEQSYNIVAFSGETFSGTGPSEGYSPGCANFDTPWTAKVPYDFRLAKSAFGRITGTVNVNEDVDDPDLTVYVSIYRNLLDCGYILVTTLPVSPDPDDDYRIIYTVDLPLGTYDVVATADCFTHDSQFDVPIPNQDEQVTVDELSITKINSCE